MAFLLNPYHDPNVPTKPIMYEMERASYRSPQDDFKPNVPGWTDVLKTPTLHIFKPLTDGGDVFVVAIRGTADFTDFKAWLPTVWNGLEGTNRWTKDYSDLTQFQEVYPPSKYTYYGVGHSLGGEILDQFIKKGMIQSGISYNPAIQTSDIPDAELAKKNYRIYASGDPLYKLMGRWNHPSEVRPSPTTWYDMFKPFILDAYNGYKQHILANPLFEGGAIPKRLKEMIALKQKIKGKKNLPPF